MGTTCIDGQTKPTWMLTDGVCKESLAFETSKREGIPDIIILRDEDDALIELNCQNDLSKGKKEFEEFVAPAVGMEFESYDDAYNYYICYDKKVGFCVRIKNSWVKRNSKENYGAVLCCSSQSFKKNKRYEQYEKRDSQRKASLLGRL